MDNPGKRIFRAAVGYFVWVFAVGFLLAPVRLFILAPRIGERWAELAEMPVMLAVIVWLARRQVHHYGLAGHQARAATVGLLALMLMLIAEFGLVLRLQGMTPADYLATRDPVSGTTYYLALLFFAIMPWWWAKRLGRLP